MSQIVIPVDEWPTVVSLITELLDNPDMSPLTSGSLVAECLTIGRNALAVDAIRLYCHDKPEIARLLYSYGVK